MVKGGGIIYTLDKPLEDSPMTQEESEDLSFQVSQLEDLIKAYARIINLFNIEDMMENKMEERV